MRHFKVKLALFVICLFSFAMVLTACDVNVSLKFMIDDTLYQTVSTKESEDIVLPEDPYREGYVFVGWFWDEGEWKEPFTANSLMDKPLMHDMAVHARFVKTEDYIVSVQANINDFEEVNDTTYSLTVDNNVKTLQLSDKVEIHHKSKWVLSSDIAGLNIIPSKTVSLEVGDNTYYVIVSESDGAKIKLYTLEIRRKPIYTLTFNTMGGEPIGDQYVEEGGFAEIVSTTKAGYEFAAWDFDFNEPVSKNTSVTAKWNPINYNVNYNLNDGINNVGNPKKFNLDTPLKLLAPERIGYTFEGWYLDANFTLSAAGQLPAADITVYARWIQGTDVMFVGANDTYKTIQSAIDAASEGSVIFVRAGAYVEEIVINKSLKLLGNNYGREQGSARLPETVIHPVSCANFNVIGSSANIKVAANNVAVDGLMLDGDNPNVKNVFKAEWKNAFTQGSNSWYTYNRKGLNVGDDLHIDGYRGIEVSTFGATHLNDVLITNNMIKNYNHAGVVMESAASGAAADTTGENAVVSNNIISNITGFGEFYQGAPYGCYGRGIIIDGNMNVRVEKNKVSDCLMGMIYTRVYAKSDTAYTITENEFVDNSVGIWINSNGGVNEAQTANPGDKYTISLFKNLVYVTNDFESVVPFYNPGEEIATTYGIIITTIERTTMDVRIEENIIKGVRYAVTSGSILANTLRIGKNKIDDVSVGVYLSTYIIGYDFFKSNNHTVAYENEITNTEFDYLVQPVNTGKTATLYTLVDILDKDGGVVLTVPADVNVPLSDNLVLLNGNYVSEFYVDPADKSLPLPTLDISGKFEVYADWSVDAVTGISVLTAPTTSVYKMATAALTVTKGVIRVHYSSGRYADVSMGSGTVPAAGVTFSGFEGKVRGYNTITVSYEGHSATFEIYVKHLLTINYNTDGKGGGTVKTAEYSHGDTTAPTATRSGYTLEGFYLDSACTIPFDGMMPSDNLTIFANWIKN